MSEEIEFRIDDRGIAILRVNRPAARNALNWSAQEAFAETVTAVTQAAAHSPPIARALILTGTGDKAFVSGGDLKELSRFPEESAGERLNRVMSAALNQLIALPIPVIAAINGDAFGGGCEILTACDLRITAPHARFSFAQVRNALTTGWGGTGRLVHLLGQSKAMDLLLTARLFDAQEAKALGLVHKIAAADTAVLTAAAQWAEELIRLPRRALAATKALVHAAPHATLAQIGQYETALFTNLWSHPDHLEALQAFMEKRPPRFNR